MATQEDVVAPAVSSAMQYKRLAAELEGIKAGVSKTKAETDAIRGRPGRILEPIVDRGVGAAENLMSGAERVLSDRNLAIMRYEVGTNARSVRDAITQTVNRLRSQFQKFIPSIPTIGSRIRNNRSR